MLAYKRMLLLMHVLHTQAKYMHDKNMRLYASFYGTINNRK